MAKLDPVARPAFRSLANADAASERAHGLLAEHSNERMAHVKDDRVSLVCAECARRSIGSIRPFDSRLANRNV